MSTKNAAALYVQLVSSPVPAGVEHREWNILLNRAKVATYPHAAEHARAAALAAIEKARTLLGINRASGDPIPTKEEPPLNLTELEDYGEDEATAPRAKSILRERKYIPFQRQPMTEQQQALLDAYVTLPSIKRPKGAQYQEDLDWLVEEGFLTRREGNGALVVTTRGKNHASE